MRNSEHNNTMNTMKLIIASVGIFLTTTVLAGENKVISKREYVDQWRETAIEQMAKHKIPASITIAQGILESGSGNSELARKGNNHFGIKCHGWTGEKMYVDDDKKGECFRVYKTAAGSYEDHSLFLNTYDRYAFLFDLEITDYKKWAEGLKKAGYATNPKYPDLLIGIIEDLKLDELDKVVAPLEIAPQLVAANETMSNKHETFSSTNVKVKFVKAKKGDTFYKIAEEFGLTLRQLYRYNDFPKEKDVLEEGDIIYIQPKKRGTLFKKEEVVADKEMTVNEIAQRYALKAKTIVRLNDFADENVVVTRGEKVTLR